MQQSEFQARMDQVRKEVELSGLTEVLDRGLCFVCHKLGAGQYNSFILCSPDCEEILQKALGVRD